MTPGIPSTVSGGRDEGGEAAKLVELGTEIPTEPVTSTKPVSVLRTGSDATGKFRMEAELVSVDDGKALLKKADGELVTVPIDELRSEDRSLLEKK